MTFLYLYSDAITHNIGAMCHTQLLMGSHFSVILLVKREKNIKMWWMYFSSCGLF